MGHNDTLLRNPPCLSFAIRKFPTAEAVSQLPLEAETRIRFEASASGICGEQSGNRTRLRPSPFIFSVSTTSTTTLNTPI